jgi:hypothetical protein
LEARSEDVNDFQRILICACQILVVLVVLVVLFGKSTTGTTGTTEFGDER